MRNLWLLVAVVLLFGGALAGSQVSAGAPGIGTDDTTDRSSDTALQSSSISITSVGNPSPGTVEVGPALDTPEGETTIDVEVENDGDTTETIETVEIDSGSEVSDTVSLSQTVSSGETVTISREFTISSDTSDDNYALDVTVTTNGTAATSNDAATIAVERPPVIEVTETTLQNVTAGHTTEFELTIEEVNDAGEDANVQSTITNPDKGTLSFPDNDLEGQLGAGERRTVSATITVDEDAEGNQTLDWELALSDAGENERTSIVSAPVLLPAQFTRVELADDAIRFDEPKDETDTIEQRIPVEVRNGGDFNLTLTDLSASIPGDQISVTGVKLNGSSILEVGTIPARRTRVVDVNVSARTILSEQERALQLNFEGDGVAGRSPDPFQKDRSIRIVHETRLEVGRTSLEFGEVAPRTVVKKEVELREALGYKDVTGVDVKRTSGPTNGWLTYSGAPDTVEAGSTETVVFELRFTTQAEQLTDFSWTHNVTADGKEPITVESRARTKPAGFDDVRSELSGYESNDDALGQLASSMLRIIDRVEGGVEDGSVPASDLSTALTTSSTLSVMIRNLDETQRIVRNDSLDRGAAQESIIRAAASYNTFRVFVGRYETEELRDTAREIERTTGEEINATVTAQKQYYQKQLPDEDSSCRESTKISCREEAEIKRQLSQLALLEGNTDEAERLDAEADEAFNSYTSLVDEAQQSYQSAQQQRNRIKTDYSVVAFGQPLVLNPLDYGAFISQQQEVLDAYETARNGFEQAGASTQADTVGNERVGASRELDVARTSMFVALGVYTLAVFWLLVHVVTGVYDFRRDKRITAGDDFLV